MEVVGLITCTFLVEVEHVKAHRTKKEQKHMSQFERFVTESNENADDLAKAVAMLDEGFMAEARAETMQQERDDVYAALQYAASFHCMIEQWRGREELKPKPKERWRSGEFSWIRRARERSVEQSGVRK